MRDVNERNRVLYGLSQKSEAIKKQITKAYEKEKDAITSLEDIDKEEKQKKLITLQSNFQDSMRIIQEYETFSNVETGRIFFTVDEILAQLFEGLNTEIKVFRQQLSTDLGTIANELKDIKKKLSKK